jgi:hypothetical protein
MSAVVYEDDKPILELSASEWIFPIHPPKNERFTILFKMKPYRSYSVKKFYDEMMYAVRSRIGPELVFTAQEYISAKKFVDQQLICMINLVYEDGSELTLEQQKKWLDQQEDLKIAVFNQGFDGVTLAPSINGNGDFTSIDKTKLVVFEIAGHKICIQWKLYSEERKEEAQVILTHYLNRITQQERHRYNQSFHLKENTRRNEQYVETNWDVVEQLYDFKVKKLEGALIEGEACTEENKVAWVPQVPFCMKAFVISQALQEIELKNA